MCRPHRSPIRFFHLHRVFLPRALPCTVVQYGMGFLHILRTSRYRIGTLWYIRWAKNSIIRYCKGGAPPSTLGREGEGAEGSVKRRSGSTEGWDHRPRLPMGGLVPVPPIPHSEENDFQSGT